MKINMLNLWQCVVLSVMPVLTSTASISNAAVCKTSELPMASYVYEGKAMKADPGETLKVRCKEEYKEDHPEITCQVDGRWSHPEPRCQSVSCLFPHTPAKGNMISLCSTFNCTATYSCPEGFRYNGTVITYCQRNERWSGVPGECEAIVCPMIPDHANGQINQTTRTYLVNATVLCNEGYVYDRPEFATRQCQSDGTWSGQDGICEPIMCEELQAPLHGKVLQPKRSYMSMATVKCDVGYIYSKPDHLTRRCQANRTWTGVEGSCEKILCSAIEEVENGIVSFRKGKFGDVVLLQCNSGHILDGPGTVTCQADKSWSSELGQCMRPKGGDNLGVVIPVVVILVLVLIGTSVLVYTKVFRKKCNSRTRETAEDEQLLSLGPLKLYCSFHLKEDFSEDNQASEQHSAGSLSFLPVLQDGIKRSVKEMFGTDLEAKIICLCNANRKVYVNLQSNESLNENNARNSIRETQFKNGNRIYHVVYGSVEFQDQTTHHLKASIHRKQHSPDKGDKRIDLNTQYVRLELATQKSIDEMHWTVLERPDHYQQDMEKEEGQEIQEEELMKGEDYEKYIAIRGRAGIGKSTLIQRLLLKWANGEWATRYKAMFMLNLRHLMKEDKQIELTKLLSHYAVYTTGDPDVVIDHDWLEENEHNISFILDGVDEIKTFRECWTKMTRFPTMEDTATPLEWCFALMKREYLKKSTIVISSRPFADLSLISTTLQEKGHSENFIVVELMGLNEKRVIEFVNKNAPEDQQMAVKEKLKSNPILMSACAITFYCAALCQVLGREDGSLISGLTTYTRITAYIMWMYIQRSMTDNKRLSLQNLYEDMSPIFGYLSKVASDGLLNPGPNGLPRLVFDQEDMSRVASSDADTHIGIRSGILMETQLEDIEKSGSTKTLTQFAHLSIQEFLAMSGILGETLEDVEKHVRKLSMSEQYNMALLFLYGLAFDDRNIPVAQTFAAATGKDSLREDVKGFLQGFACEVPSDLQALQIAHESQSREVAEKVATGRFKQEMSLKGSKLTAIDIIALLFVMRESKDADTLRLEDVGLDKVSLEEIAKFLRTSHKLKTFDLCDRTLKNEHIQMITKALQSKSTLKSLSLKTSAVTDEVMDSISQALEGNETLKCLSLNFEKVTDKGLMVLADTLRKTSLEILRCRSTHATDEAVIAIANALKDCKGMKEISLDIRAASDHGVEHLATILESHSTIEVLKLHSKSVTDTGIGHLAQMLKKTKSLTELRLSGFTPNDEGWKAIQEAMNVNSTVQIWMWKPKLQSDLLVPEHLRGRITLN